MGQGCDLEEIILRLQEYRDALAEANALLSATVAEDNGVIPIFVAAKMQTDTDGGGR